MWYRKTILVLGLIAVCISLSMCVNADAVETLQNNLNMSVADIILLIISCGCIVIGAFDSRIAIMCAFLLYAILFIVFTLATDEGHAGFNPYFAGLAMMVCFVVLCLMLLISYKKTNTPYNVV